MTWVKLPDDALDDPLVSDLEPDVVIDYLRVLGWSNRWARDGRVPHRTAGPSAPTWVAAGLAEDAVEGVQLVWLMEHQPTADEIRGRRRVDAERQARRRRHMAGDHSACDPTRCHALKSRGDTPRDSRPESEDPDPSRPEPTPPDPKEGEEEEERRDGDNGPGEPVASPSREEQIEASLRQLHDPDFNDFGKEIARRNLERLGVEVPAA